MHSLHVKRLEPNAKLPTVAHPGEDLGYDLYALEDTPVHYGRTTIVRTGIAATALKQQFDVVRNGPGLGNVRAMFLTGEQRMGMLIRDRSSMASKGVFTHGGVIDAGYTGEIKVLMTNEVMGTEYRILAGDKIAQMIPVEVLTGGVVEVETLTVGDRGEGGFGSTGR